MKIRIVSTFIYNVMFISSIKIYIVSAALVPGTEGLFFVRYRQYTRKCFELIYFTATLSIPFRA